MRIKWKILPIIILFVFIVIKPTVTFSSAEESVVNLNLSNGLISITPTGYSQNGGSEIAFTGTYVISGSKTGDTPLNITNNSGSSVTFNIILDNAEIIGSIWSTAVRFNGNSEIILNITNKGSSKIEADNHPAFQSSSDDVKVKINIINEKDSQLYLGVRYMNCETVIYNIDTISCSINGKEISDDINKNTSTGPLSWTWKTYQNESGSLVTVVCSESSEEEMIWPCEHTAGEPIIENKEEATCTTNGSYDSVLYCSVCKNEISRETIIVEATGHTEGEEVIENIEEATYTTNGSYDKVVYCSVCGEELSREREIISIKEETEDETSDEYNQETDTEETTPEEEEKETTDTTQQIIDDSNNPKTSDNIIIIFSMLIISLLNILIIYKINVNIKK